MKIIFFGDSLTKGQVGASFIKLLANRFPNDHFINRGTNGDTLNVIATKTLNHLVKHNDFDFVVLQGGGNDLLLPYFKARGGLFRFAYNSQIRNGLVPLKNPTEYYEALVALFTKMKTLYGGQVIFITMSCLNEKLDTDLNRRRSAFNDAARKAAFEEGVLIADIEPVFEQILSDRPQTDYLIESFWAVTIFDRLMGLFSTGITHLSARRKLFLTIDGAHLNNKGAAIIRDSIVNLLAPKAK